MKDIHKIRDLDQVRLLSDPLKLRLLQAHFEEWLDALPISDPLPDEDTKEPGGLVAF